MPSTIQNAATNIVDPGDPHERLSLHRTVSNTSSRVSSSRVSSRGSGSGPRSRNSAIVQTDAAGWPKAASLKDQTSVSSNATYSSSIDNHSSSSRSQAGQPVKEKPLEQILAQPYGDATQSAEDDFNLITYSKQSGSSGSRSSRKFEKVSCTPWVPSLHASVDGKVVTIPQSNVSSGSPHSGSVRSVSPPPELRTIVGPSNARDSLRTPSEAHSSIRAPSESHSNRAPSETLSTSGTQVLPSPRDRLSSLKSRTHSFPSIVNSDSSAEAATRKPSVHYSSRVWVKNSPTAPSTASIAQSQVIEEEGETVSSVAVPSEHHQDDVYYDISSPPLAYYRHIPRIFGVQPPQISGHACSRIDSKLFIFGGKTPSGHSDKLYIFNTVTNQLTCPKLEGHSPPPMRDMSSCVINDRYIYYFGGQDSVKSHNTVYVLDVKRLSFSRLIIPGKAPEPRSGHAAVVRRFAPSASDAPVVADTEIRGSVAEHRPSITSMTSYLSHRGSTSSAVSRADHAIYIFGGTNDSHKVLNDLWKLNVSAENPYDCSFVEIQSQEKGTNKWPSPRANHTAHLHDGSMLVYGGNDMSNRVFKSIWRFDFTQESWSPIPTIGQRPRTLHMADLAEGRLIVIGGHDGEASVTSIDILDIAAGKWQTRGCNGVQLHGQCLHHGAFYDSRIYTIGGLDPVHIVAGVWIIEMPNIYL